MDIMYKYDTSVVSENTAKSNECNNQYVLLVIIVWLNLSNSFCKAFINQLIVNSQTMRTDRMKNTHIERGSM